MKVRVITPKGQGILYPAIRAISTGEEGLAMIRRDMNAKEPVVRFGVGEWVKLEVERETFGGE